MSGAERPSGVVGSHASGAPISLREQPVHERLAGRIRALIQRFPPFGYRRLWAWLRFRERRKLVKKTVYRLLQIQAWFVHQRQATSQPRAHGWRSVATASNHRCAMDVTHIPCGADGWDHLATVIDCLDHETIGYEFALRSRADEAERALEEACLRCSGTLRASGKTPLVRSDNGLILQSRLFRAACWDCQFTQEFITPYTREQNSLSHRFFRSLQEECVWLHHFPSFPAARSAVIWWIQWYNEHRPHQALNDQSPAQFRAQQQLPAA